MGLLVKIDAATRLVATRLTRSRMPIVVRWQTTNRCTARCRYCEIWKSPGDDLSTAEAERMILDFRALGMRRLGLSGGEPLLREDIDALVSFALAERISVEMNTNGVLLAEHLATARRMDLVKVSLDGPAELHDRIRRAPMYREIMENLAAARGAGVRFGITATLARENTSVEVVDHLLGVAERFDTFVAFQPVVSTTPWGTGDMEEIAPTPAQMRTVVEHLIRVKRTRGARLRNSLAGLRHLRDWPRFPPLICTAGTVFVIVESNGDLYACERTGYPEGTVFPNVRDGVREAFDAVVQPDCGGCGFCGALELNFLWNLDFSAAREVARTVRLPYHDIPWRSRRRG
jgi:MoaA/NifB/PqqE/SkfB family radical SAM enzyme